jgi:hypothetical protein
MRATRKPTPQKAEGSRSIVERELQRKAPKNKAKTGNDKAGPGAKGRRGRPVATD